MKIKKAIIPAAGLGTRFLPATKSQPKEMLPIVDKPCIQYLVEEAVESGIEDIIIITGDGKESIEQYFAHSKKLQKHLEDKGNKEAAKELKKIEKMAKFRFVKQEEPLGDGHAILCAKDLIKNEPFAVLFGDDIYDSRIPPLTQMIRKFEKLETPIIALEEIELKDADKYGIIEPESHEYDVYKIKGLVEKPSPKKAPSNLAITGKYIITPELLETLEKTQKSPKSELRLINGMQQYIKKSHIVGLKIQGQRFDTGDKLGYLKAVVHFAQKNSTLGKEFKKHLQGLDIR